MSCLAALDELKIDKIFVQNMLENQTDEQTVRSVIDLAHNFDLEAAGEWTMALRWRCLPAWVATASRVTCMRFQCRRGTFLPRGRCGAADPSICRG